MKQGTGAARFVFRLLREAIEWAATVRDPGLAIWRASQFGWPETTILSPHYRFWNFVFEEGGATVSFRYAATKQCPCQVGSEEHRFLLVLTAAKGELGRYQQGFYAPAVPEIGCGRGTNRDNGTSRLPSVNSA